MNHYIKTILLGSAFTFCAGSTSASLFDDVEIPINSIGIEFTYDIGGEQKYLRLNGLAGKDHTVKEDGYVHMKCQSNGEVQTKTLGQDLLKTGMAAAYSVGNDGKDAMIKVTVYPAVRDVADQIKAVNPNECKNISPSQNPIKVDTLKVDYTQEPKERVLPNTGVRIKYYFYKT